MMVGLQGSGKTTTTAKIARRLTEQGKRKVWWLRSTRAVRPRWSSSRCSGSKSTCRRYRSYGPDPAANCERALEAARLGGFDVVMLDTAGRTTLDEEMMAEAAFA